MAKILPATPIDSIRGKLGRFSDWAAALRLGVHYLIHIGKRNYRKHPVTAEERKTHQRLRQASLDYNALDPASEEYRTYYAAFLRQKRYKHGKQQFRSYFISRRMNELKSTGSLSADPTRNLQDWSHKSRRKS